MCKILLLLLFFWLFESITAKCGVVSGGRRCKCVVMTHVRCMDANYGRLPPFDKSVKAMIVSLNMRVNLIGTITEHDLKGYNSLKLLDLRLQKGGCVRISVNHDQHPTLTVLGTCTVSAILLFVAFFLLCKVFHCSHKTPPCVRFVDINNRHCLE